MATTGKTVQVIFEKTLETYENQMQMLDLVDIFKPGGGDLQNSGNVLWRPVQQHAPLIDGWDLTGQETGIIEETYPAVLLDPVNDFFEQRADDMRTLSFWEKRGEQSGMRQATELNSRITQQIIDTGSLFYRTDATNGYVAISQGQAILNERQKRSDNRRYVMINDRDMLTYSGELSGRQTMQGRPENAWRTGQIGQNIAEFDVYTGSFLKNVTGGAITTSTVSANVVEVPEAGSVNTVTNTVTNVDYRVGTIPVVSSAAYNVGDWISITNDPGGTPVVVESIGLADKNPSGQPMSFKIVDKDLGGANQLTVYPKPIAADQAGITVLEAASANISTAILAGAEVVKLNIDATKKANVFWQKDSIEVFSGDAPLQLLNEFGGQKVVSKTMKNGQTLYMTYDGDIDKLTFKCRLFTWYTVTNKDPSANGVFVSF